MKKIFYEKIGRRYVPVSEYDTDFVDSFHKGNHLVMSYPGGSSRRYNIDPNYAAMIAAGRVAEDAIAKALTETSNLRMRESDRKRELTVEQKNAWENLVKLFGESASRLEWASTREIAEAGVKAMQDEAMKLMENETVKKAYDHFILVSLLTKENNNEKS